MARQGLRSRDSLAMRITMPISQRPQTFDDCLAAAEYLLEQLLGVLAR